MTAPTRTDAATLFLDLRCMIAAETPESDWISNVEWLIGRPLSAREQANVLHNLRGYRDAPWSTLWQSGVRSLARLLVAGGMK